MRLMFAIVCCILLMERFSNRSKRKVSFLWLLYFLQAFFRSVQVVRLYITSETHLFAEMCFYLFLGWWVVFLFFLSTEIGSCLAQCVNVMHLSAFWHPGFLCFKAFFLKQVSCRETFCINWHIETTTEAPLVNNYWAFKLWAQISPGYHSLGPWR